MSSNVSMHCGARPIDFADLDRLPVPERSQSHLPIPHSLLVRQVRELLPSFGLKVQRETFWTAAKHNRFFGIIDLIRPDQTAESHSWSLGLRNTHDKSFAAGLASGSRVFVCDNLAFHGTHQFSRRHTAFIVKDLPDLCLRALEAAETSWRAQDQLFRAWQTEPIDQVTADHLILEGYRQKCFPANQIADIVQEFRQPRYPHHLSDRGQQTIWTLFNAMTEVAKQGPVMRLEQRTRRFSRLLAGEWS